MPQEDKIMNNHNKSTEVLQQELALKIHELYKDQKAFVDYILQTKNNFLFRYLETSLNKNIQIQMPKLNFFLAESFENNMGNAFKTENSNVKEGVKNLAKSVDRALNPQVKYTLSTDVQKISENGGKIIIKATIDWGFPEFNNSNSQESKMITFIFNDVGQFRKELALKYEEACELFL